MGLCLVVPFSMTPPHARVQYQCKVDIGTDPPEPFAGQIKWAKADMINTVCYERLSLPYAGRCPDTRKRKYIKIRLPKAEMHKVRCAMMHGLGLPDLIKHLEGDI